jgi:hypothetical protein
MSTSPVGVQASSTLGKVAIAGAIADGLLKPLSGADDTSAAAQGTAAAVDTAAQIATALAPQYAGEIKLAESLEPVAYHAGYAIAHFLQHLFHRTVSQTAAPAAPVKA